MNNIEKLKEYDRLYFASGESPLTDTQYDQLKTKAKKEFPDHPYFDEVGFKITSEYRKIKLPFVIGGLEKVDVDSVVDWVRKSNSMIVASEKLDGNSIVTTWDNGKLIFAASRGNENEGQDILEKAKYFIHDIPEKGRVTLRGEIVLEGDLFKHFGFKNRRNGVTGLLRRDEIKSNDLKLLSALFYEVIESPVNIPLEIDRFNYISSLGLRTPIAFEIEIDEKSLGILPNYLAETLMEVKESASYDIDGLVLTVNKSVRENVKQPKNKVKFKVNEGAVRCKVIGIEWNITRMGYIVPVILIHPTVIMGVTVSRAAGFHAEFIMLNEIGVGSEIGVVRAGDVTPYVDEIYTQSDFTIPTHCPECGGRTEMKSKNLICLNKNCTVKNFLEVSHFFITLGVDGISDKTIENIGISNIRDMYLLTKENLEKLPGFGESKSIKVVNEIQKTLKTKPEYLLAAFGIPLIGKTLSKKLISKFTIDDLFNIEDPEIIGLGPITSKSLTDNLYKFREFYEFLKSIGLEFIQDTGEKPMKGIKFALTGDGPIKRTELQKMIEAAGGEVGSCGKGTNYLVTNDPDSVSGKMKAAIKNGVKIIGYDILIGMMGGV